MIHLDTTVIYTLLGVIGLMVADWVMGVLASLRTGTFAFDALPKQLETTVLPYLGSLTVLAALQAVGSGTAASGPLAGVFAGAVATYVPKAGLDIAEKAGILLDPPAAPTAAPVATKP